MKRKMTACLLALLFAVSVTPTALAGPPMDADWETVTVAADLVDLSGGNEDRPAENFYAVVCTLLGLDHFGLAARSETENGECYDLDRDGTGDIFITSTNGGATTSIRRLDTCSLTGSQTFGPGAGSAVSEDAFAAYMKSISAPGYVSKLIIRLSAESGGAAGGATHTVTAGALTIRETPSADSSRIGGLTQGDGVQVTETYGDWAQIRYDGGLTGWVMRKYLAPASAAPANPFADVAEGDYWYMPVQWAYYAHPQVTNGMDATHFGPAQTVTRGQCVTFLWRAQGEPEPMSTKNPFVDVKTSDYYYKAVLWAVEKNITVGTDATHFTPDQTCSTAHIITFLFRTLGVGDDGWYEAARDWAVFSGLMNRTDLSVTPGTNCPRGAVVTFLYRAAMS